MKIELSHKFIKIYKKRFSHLPNIQKKFDDRVRLFEKDSNDPILDDHALTGEKLGFRAFSITGDIRVVYYLYRGIAYFVDIGSHNQVY